MKWSWFLLLAIFLAFLPTPLSAQGRPPIIDMHMHARPKVELGPDGKPLRLPCAPQPCTSGPAVYTTDDSILRGTLAEMQKYNVVKGFLSDELGNVYVYRWLEAAPDRFIPSVGVFSRQFPDIEKLRESYRRGRLKGMGEIGTQYVSIAPNDPRLEPYFALAEEMDVPMLIHTLGFGDNRPGFRSSLGHPLLLEEVLVRHTKLRIYLENAGFPFLDEMIALMYQYPQVYGDVSTITWIIPRKAFHSYLKGLVDAGLGKRVMFGSDQMQWPETIGLAIEAIESADFLTAEQKRDIFYNNAARFLKLTPEEIAGHHRQASSR